MRITKAIIPAGGLGTRMWPLSRYLPKEMLPLGRQPVLQWIVDEFRQAGFTDILLLTHADKPFISDYFEGCHDVHVLGSRSPSGTGYAVQLAREFVGDSGFVVAFGDAPIGGAKASELLPFMLDAHKEFNATSTIAIQRIPVEDQILSGVVVASCPINATPVRLTDILEKPLPRETSSTWASACRYIFDSTIFDVPDQIPRASNGELQLTDAIRSLIFDGYPIYGFPLQKDQKRFDTGSFNGYFEAFAYFAQSDADSLPKRWG